MSVEEAIKMVISGGIVTPPDRRSEFEKAQVYTAAAVYEEVDVVREKDGSPILVAKGTRPGEMQNKIRGEIDE